MHEMSLAEGIVELIEEAAAKQGFSSVKLVALEIGRLSSVEPEALAFCFDAATRGSIAEGAKLEIDNVPGRGVCLQCGAEVEMENLYDPCPKCGAYGLRVTGGTEMRVKELEVD
ncbi:MAG TPA: hydrogenase maturation nickel metallochaperone HypA [Rhodocyclaceae bacterium]|nr:hydrogenase maturation nickel metallochaperone HypA [Rhodocyclaceae bacterium]